MGCHEIEVVEVDVNNTAVIDALDERGVIVVDAKGVDPVDLVEADPGLVADLCEEYGAKAVQFVTYAKAPLVEFDKSTGKYEVVEDDGTFSTVGPLHVPGTRDPWEDEVVPVEDKPVVPEYKRPEARPVPSWSEMYELEVAGLK